MNKNIYNIKNYHFIIIFIILTGLIFLIINYKNYIYDLNLCKFVKQSIEDKFKNDENLKKYDIKILDIKLKYKDKCTYHGNIKIFYEGKERDFPIRVLNYGGRLMWETSLGSYSFVSPIKNKYLCN
jgi:hypothetical protein